LPLPPPIRLASSSTSAYSLNGCVVNRISSKLALVEVAVEVDVGNVNGVVFVDVTEEGETDLEEEIVVFVESRVTF
jgi:hypothetical protein